MTANEFGNLTDTDLDTLLEALTAWETKDFAGEMMGDLFGAMLMPKDNPEAKAKFEAENVARREKAKAAQQARKEQSILLQAKLLTIRSHRRVATLVA